MQGRNLGISSTQNVKGKSITVYNTYNHTKISQEPAGTHVVRHLILKRCTVTHYHTNMLRFCRGNSREQGEMRRVYEQCMESKLLSASRKMKHITETNCVGRQRHDEGEGIAKAQKEEQ